MPETSAIQVDCRNPGEFYACCGLFELAERLWPGSEAWFGDGQFYLRAPTTGKDPLRRVIAELRGTEVVSLASTAADRKTAPLRLGPPFSVVVDWWSWSDGSERLKTWAGQQSVFEIAASLKSAIPDDLEPTNMLTFEAVVRAPFYFDARRFANRLDVGYSLDLQSSVVVARPLVELLSLVGLQRFRAVPVPGERWAFWYATWPIPLSPGVAAAWTAISEVGGGETYRFSLAFRDDSKRYKAVTFASQVRKMDDFRA